MNTKKPTKLNAISTFMIASLVSASAAAAPLALDGKITEIALDGSTITVMGVTVTIPAGTLINSPTKSLTLAELASQTSLPGRELIAGFIGGTAIINGLTAFDPGNTLFFGQNIAEDVFVEPAENVLLGEVTANPGDGVNLEVSGVTLQQLDDSRIPAGVPIDANGLAINLATTPLGAAAAAEGHFGDNGVFYYFLIETVGDSGCATCRPADAVSVTRARCRDNDEIRVLGGVADVDGQLSATVEIVNFGTAPVILDPATGEITYSFRGNVNGACPATVTVDYAAASATADVDIR